MKNQLLFIIAFLLSTRASAQTNTAPPLERYTCYQVYAPSLTYTYMGYFQLLPGNKYTWGYGSGKATSVGSYNYSTKGMLFTGGKLNTIYGTFETNKKGRHVFDLKIKGKKLYASDDGIITWYCNCDEHDPYNKKAK